MQLQAQDSLRIGLVLSGGGAKALAHIGLLRVMDEEGLQPDFIAGTSMGGVIGALYAMGYSAVEIQEEMYRIDWNAIMLNDRPRKSLSYLDKGTEDRYLLSFPFKDGRPSLPNGINYGQRIINELDRLTIGAHHISDFNDLPIPFACLATDLETGDGVILDTGYLPDALRATSSFPTLYSPYELNGKILVDGGLIENLPFRLLEDKDINVIIGSDVQNILHNRDELTNVFSVLEQISGFVNAKNFKRDSARAMFIVRPNVPDAGVTTFDMLDSIFNSGYRDAEKYRNEIRELVAKKGRQKVSRRLLPNRRDSLHIACIETPNTSLSSFDHIRVKMDLKEGVFTSDRGIVEGMNRLWGTQLYNTADFRLMPDIDSSYMLQLRLNERKSMQQIRLGLHYDDDFQTAVLVNYTHRNLLFRNSKFSLDAAIGVNPRFWLDYTIDRELVPTFRLSFRSHRFQTSIYANRQLESNKTYLDFSLSGSLQSVFADRFLISGGIQIEGIDLNATRSEIFPESYYENFLNYFGILELDLLDQSTFPNKGLLVKGKYRVITNTDEYNSGLEPSSVLDVKYLQVIPIWKGSSIYLKGALATTIGPDLDYAYSVFLGGLGENYINYMFSFVGYRFMELVGRNALVGGVDFNWQFSDNHYLIAKANYGTLENSFDELFQSDVLLDGYGLSYAYDSPLGPLQFTVMGSSNHADIYTYVNLGYWF
jgi:NTE family protein